MGELLATILGIATGWGICTIVATIGDALRRRRVARRNRGVRPILED